MGFDRYQWAVAIAGVGLVNRYIRTDTVGRALVWGVAVTLVAQVLPNLCRIAGAEAWIWWYGEQSKWRRVYLVGWFSLSVMYEAVKPGK